MAAACAFSLAGVARDLRLAFRVQSIIRVASPPAKAVMIYDGDCNFCSLWVHRWQQSTRDRLDYLPFQDPRVAACFPEVPRGQFEIAVALIQTDGTVYGEPQLANFFAGDQLAFISRLA